MSSGSQIGGAVGAVVGGVIGFYMGNPAQGAQWGYAIGSAVGGYVDPTRTYGPRLEDAAAQTSTVGGVIPFGYGTFTCAGNIIWTDRLIEHVKTERVGKGGSERQTTYTYTRSYAIGVCEGDISNYMWIKKNGKIVYASNPAVLGAAMGWDVPQINDLHSASAEFRQIATMYYGTDTQMPDPVIEAVEGVGNVSPFRDLAYIVLEHEDLTDMQGAVSQYEFCVQAEGVAYATSPPYALETVDSYGLSTEHNRIRNTNTTSRVGEYGLGAEISFISCRELQVRQSKELGGYAAYCEVEFLRITLARTSFDNQQKGYALSTELAHIQNEQIRVALDSHSPNSYGLTTQLAFLENIEP